MNKKAKQHLDESSPQTVTEFIEVDNGQKTIKIGFTEQKVSPHAGLSTFVSFLQWQGWKMLLEKVLPERTSPNAKPAIEVALSFMVGVLAGARKLAQVGYLQGDRVLPQLLGIKAMASQYSLSRYFRKFKGAYENSACFGALWRGCVERLPSRAGGYTLDLDTTRLLHEDAHGKEGVRTGYTPKGIRRCYHPLLAVIAEAKLVAGFWLRAGNTRCDNNVVGFTRELLARLPQYIRIGLVRADSGFFEEQWLQMLELRHLAYIVVGRLVEPVRQLIRKSTRWEQTDLPGTDIAEELYQGYGWACARRVLLIRHRVAERPEAGGKALLGCSGYVFQVLVTSLPLSVPPIEVWRKYNGRAGSESVIKELNQSFALPQICLEKFYATEAAMSLAVLTYNLCVLFQRHLGWQDRVNAATLRFRLFTAAGIISQTGGYTTLRLAIRQGPLRQWWARLLEKISCPFRNCVAVDPQPPPFSLSEPLTSALL
ncbi:MAG: IS1380 family transposase [Ktedonobacteraceae bacterium]|nr:IS1380 family transposase [Ktedonobacteraceae bacterium]